MEMFGNWSELRRSYGGGSVRRIEGTDPHCLLPCLKWHFHFIQASVNDIPGGLKRQPLPRWLVLVHQRRDRRTIPIRLIYCHDQAPERLSKCLVLFNTRPPVTAVSHDCLERPVMVSGSH